MSFIPIDRDAGFISVPVTLEQFAHNVQFQLDNVNGYLLYRADKGGDLAVVLAKAKCCVEAAQALLAAVDVESKKVSA